MIPVSIVLRSQVSRDEVIGLTRAIPDRSARRAAVSARLREAARVGQAPLLRILASEAAAGRAANVRPLWISSVIGAELTPGLIQQLAARDDVDHVNYNPKRDVFLGPPACFEPDTPPALLPPAPVAAAAAVTGTDEIECGVTQMRAPEVWNVLGQTGEGAVVALIDTGVCPTHPDIVNQIWVNPGEDLDQDGVVMDPSDQNGVDDDGNGFIDDLIGWNFDLGNNNPTDGAGHGSHCAGTIAGDGTSGTQSGMAPDARIMVVRVGTTFADEVDVWNGMQYAADNGADAISMSLGWPHGQNPDRATWRTNCENTIDLGTAMVIAAGNEGSGNAPDNVRTPGDVPRVITVGATDCADQVAGFSSRGPVTWQNVPPFGDHPYPPGLIKPDVSAPGVNTKSHSFCSGYTFMSGTSMATPHVAGAVALMVGANPNLEHDEIKQVLRDTAVDRGVPGNDNEYGQGRVDAYEAVSRGASKLIYESHTVSDANPAYGNGDGNVDIGEIVRLTVTLRDKGTTTATGIWAILSTTNPAIDVVDSVAFYPDIPAGATAASLSPHFSFRLGSGCGQSVLFRLEIRHDGGGVSYSSFTLQTGLFEQRTIFQDDMEIDRGWAPGGPEVNGRFDREAPWRVTNAAGAEITPDDDATPAPGVRCWITGNPRPKGHFNPDDGDVDTEAWLDSPVIDASGVQSLTVDLARWFYMDPPTLFESTHYEVLVSNDGGTTWGSSIDSAYGAAPTWTFRSLVVPIPATNQVRLRVRVVESAPGGAGTRLVEGLVDDVRVWGSGYFCDAWSAPPADPPNPVGGTLRSSPIGDSLRLDWTAPPVDGLHDAASEYRIYRSSFPSSGFALTHTATATFRVEDRELTRPGNVYYLVASANAGGSSGEEP